MKKFPERDDRNISQTAEIIINSCIKDNGKATLWLILLNTFLFF
ncbi:hypothetical protein [Sideroxydans sp. CL21]|nr:hypothetical protein [Sideroxydans sp. CL21]